MRRHLDAQMVTFVRASPFVQLATADADGLPFVSPKGDDPGFVVVVMEEVEGEKEEEEEEEEEGGAGVTGAAGGGPGPKQPPRGYIHRSTYIYQVLLLCVQFIQSSKI